MKRPVAATGLLLGLVALAPGASALAYLDEGPLVHRGVAGSVARFTLLLRVEADADVRVALSPDWRGEATATPASRAAPGAGAALPATFRLEANATGATWRGYRGVFALVLAVETPATPGPALAEVFVAPARGAGVSVPLRFDLTPPPMSGGPPEAPQDIPVPALASFAALALAAVARRKA